jgi:MoaA/NifB/PqqE/SkfB family radical SAM enzyme
MEYTRVDLSKYIVISIWFGCNNNCSICMLSGLKSKLSPIGFDNFKRIVTDIANTREFESLILSGADVTTFKDLDKYIQFAASLGYFKKIQIQTNGRRLSDKKYLKYLIDCGVNEFFLSIQGLEKMHDTITQNLGSFRETMNGIKNLEEFDVNVISNTVLTKNNIKDIPMLFKTLAEKKISEIHMWNFFPMENTSPENLMVDLKTVIQLLPDLYNAIGPSGKPLVLKSFPECLPIKDPGFFDNFFPVTVLPDEFWRKFSECGFGICCHRDACKLKSCWGLSKAYIEQFGDEQDLLSPVR